MKTQDAVKLQRIEHTKNPWRPLIQVFPDCIFEEGDIIYCFDLGVTNEIHKTPY